MDLELLRRTEYNQQYIAAMRPVFNRRAFYGYKCGVCDPGRAGTIFRGDDPFPYRQEQRGQNIPRKRWAEAPYGTSGER